MWGSNSEEIRLADIGVRSDGVTDNAPTLLALRDELRADPARHYRFVCPPGEMRYSDPRWLMGLQNVTVVGYGTRLVSTSAMSLSPFKNPFFGGDIFETNPYSFTGTWTYDTGHQFHSASAGRFQIALTTPEDAALFAPGNRVFLGGFDQQGSNYPPNWRYFEWKTISAVDAAAGTLTFQDPLLNAYDENWHDVPAILAAGKSGKPRVFLIDRDPNTIAYAKTAEFIGLTMGLSLTPDSGGSFRGAFSFPAEVLRARDLTIEGPCWPGQNRVAEYIDCTMCGSTEPDKLADKVTFVRPKFRGHVLAATGVNDLEISGGSGSGYMEVMPRRLTLKDGFTWGSNDSNASLLPYPLPSPVQRITLDGVRLAGGPSMTNAYHVRVGWDRTITVGGISGTSILIPFASFADTDANWAIVRSLDYGMTLHKNDGSKIGTITGITFDQPNNQWIIAGTWPAPVIGEAWLYKNVGEIIAKRVRALDGRTIFDAGSAVILSTDSVT